MRLPMNHQLYPLLVVVIVVNVISFVQAFPSGESHNQEFMETITDCDRLSLVDCEFAKAEAEGMERLKQREMDADVIDDVRDVGNIVWDDFEDGIRKYRHKRSLPFLMTDEFDSKKEKEEWIVNRANDSPNNGRPLALNHYRYMICLTRQILRNDPNATCDRFLSPNNSHSSLRSSQRMRRSVAKASSNSAQVRNGAHVSHLHKHRIGPLNQTMKTIRNSGNVPKLVIFEPEPMRQNKRNQKESKNQISLLKRDPSHNPTKGNINHSKVDPTSGPSSFKFPHITMIHEREEKPRQKSASNPTKEESGHEDAEHEQDVDKEKDHEDEVVRTGLGLKHHSKGAAGKEEKREKMRQIHKDEDKTEGKGIRKETEKEHYIETIDGTGKKEKEKSDSDGAAWSKELGKLGFDWFKDKGHRKHGWKNVYHKEEWGDSKKYHDIFHDRDWKKKWNKWDKEKEKKRKEKIEKKKANKEDEKKKAAKSVKKKQKKRGKHEMGSHLKTSERKSDGEKKKEEHGIGLKEQDDHHKHQHDDDDDHDSKASKRYVYRQRNRSDISYDSNKEPDVEDHKKHESGTTRDESNGSGDKDDDEVEIRSSKKNSENDHLSSSLTGHGMAKRGFIPENSKTSASSSSRKNLKHQRPRHVYQQLLTHNQHEQQHGINESMDQDDGENWKKIRRGRRRQEAGDEEEGREGDEEERRSRSNRKHNGDREGRRGEEGQHEISLADSSAGGQEVKLQPKVKLRHEHQDEEEEEDEEDRRRTSDRDVTRHDPGFKGKKKLMRQQQQYSSSSSFDPLYHDVNHDHHRDLHTVSSFSSDLPASYRHQVPRSLLLPFTSHQDQHGYRPAVHPNDLYRPAGSHPSLFHPILPHFLF